MRVVDARRISARSAEAQVERHLVVAAAAGVQLAADRADQLGQPALDRHVDVLVGGREAERAGVELLLDLARGRASSLLALGGGEDAARAPACGTCASAAGDVVAGRGAVDGERGGELLDDRRRRRRRSGRPTPSRVRRRPRRRLMRCIARRALRPAPGCAAAAREPDEALGVGLVVAAAPPRSSRCFGS